MSIWNWIFGKKINSPAVNEINTVAWSTSLKNLPPNFEWLNSIGPLPPMLQEAIKMLGIKEIPGAKSNPQILMFAQEIGVADIYKNDDTSWCAVSHNAAAIRAGLPVSLGKVDKYDRLRAKAFAQEGNTLDRNEWEVIERTKSLLGDTMIFTRPGGGHIGQKVGESKTHFYIIGGNQNNMQSFTRVAKERLYAVRRPRVNNTYSSVKNYILNDTGVPITTNEA